jgi:flagellar biosynthesis/type III secretory pathway chaperone
MKDSHLLMQMITTHRSAEDFETHFDLASCSSIIARWVQHIKTLNWHNRAIMEQSLE